MGGMSRAMQDRLPQIAKNTILRDNINNEQTALAKQGPMMVRNPKKVAKEGTARPSVLGG
jgi:hypothetical protein